MQNFRRTEGRCARVARLSLLASTLVAAGCMAAEPTALAGPLPDILQPDSTIELPDYSYAGYRYGLEAIPTVTGTVVRVTDHGAIANDEIDDSAAILKALEEANAVSGPVIVEFPAGRLIVSDILPIERGQIVLRGQGSGALGTELHFPRPLEMVETGDRFEEITEYLISLDKRQKEPDRNINRYFSPYSWTGGFIWVQKPGTRAAAYLEERDPPITVLAQAESGQRGARQLRVSDASSFSAGQVVQLQWFNREGEDGPLLREIYGDTDLKIGSHHWTFENRPLVRQSTRITAIDGDMLTLGDPLLHTVSAEVPAQVAQWEHLSEVGIEDIFISFPDAPAFGHHLERGYNGIYMTSVMDGWVRDVRVLNADAGIMTYNSANLTLRDIRTQGERRAHYAVHLGNVHNVLVQDIIVENPVVHSLTFNTQNTRSVYQRALVLREPALDQHAGSNHQNLFDSVTMHVEASPLDRGAAFKAWDGSGAPYWQPGHGRFNTTWNLRVLVNSGAARDETVTLQGLAEGPDARLVGLHGNRVFEVDYRPEPYIEALNAVPTAPSLYDWQLERRRDALAARQ